ncbi:SymE family type I addiction module toxin [Paraburkholderia edwinii]
MSGRWLEKAGFEIGSKIRVEVERGKLTITPA